MSVIIAIMSYQHLKVGTSCLGTLVVAILVISSPQRVLWHSFSVEKRENDTEKTKALLLGAIEQMVLSMEQVTWNS
jgi:hypothetical protein